MGFAGGLGAGAGGQGAEEGSPSPNWSTRPSASQYGDDPEYQELFAVFARTVRPQDPVEWLLLVEYVDREWEVRKYHRWEASLIYAAQWEGLRGAMNAGAFREGFEADESALDPGVKHFYRELRNNRSSGPNVNLDLIEAESYLVRGDALDRIHKRLVTAERRRNAALREIEHRRQRMAKSVAETSGALMKAFLEEVEKWRGVDSRILQQRPPRLGDKRSR